MQNKGPIEKKDNKRPMERQDKEVSNFEERILNIRRTSTKRAGGASYHFSALAVVGDRNGKIGVALAKSKENIVAIRKAIEKAKRQSFDIPLTDKGSIPFEVRSKHGASKLFMKPAPLGAGIIAGSGVRQILELAGIKNVSSKIIGSTNQINIAYATVEALKELASKKKEK